MLRRLGLYLSALFLIAAGGLFIFAEREGVMLWDIYWMPYWLAAVLVAILLFILRPARRSVSDPDPAQLSRDLERKITLSKLALFAELLWPRLWVLVGIGLLFIVASLAGLWPLLSQSAHIAVLAAFGLAALIGAIAVLRVPLPTREQALNRLDRRSSVQHRPAASFEDTLSLNKSDPATGAIWKAHRQRLAKMLAKLRVQSPQPEADRHDPYALRSVLVLVALILVIATGDGIRDRLASAFRFGSEGLAAAGRLDAWLTPPLYTRKPPVILANGGIGQISPAIEEGKPVAVPHNSQLVVRSSGKSSKNLAIELSGDDGKPKRIKGKSVSSDGQVTEVRHHIKLSGVVRIFEGRTQLAKWSFNVIPDRAPTIELLKPPEISPHGGMKLSYKVTDDYGVASAQAIFEPLPEDKGNPKTAWARNRELSGARPPLEKPPVIALRLPSTRSKKPEATSFRDLNSHPWGGRKVLMTLVARDHAGNIGRSVSRRMFFPERRFFNPLAKSIVELRRKYANEARYGNYVRRAINALTYKPAGFVNDTGVFLGLRSVYHRIGKGRTRSNVKSVLDHMWHIALRIEDGRGLSDAQRRLREIQRRLARALREGASDEEIRRLMQQLRQALSKYMQELARQARNQQMRVPRDFRPNQSLTQRDLDRMLRDLENMARHGSRQMAQQMLDQLRNLLDRLQAGRRGGQRGRQGRGNARMRQLIDRFGNIIGNQQRLLDDTFESRRRGRNNQKGQNGKRLGRGELARRQGQLEDQLGKLRRGLGRMTRRVPGQLKSANEAMRNAERALRKGDLDTATREQRRALDQLRQGARQLARQMLRNLGPRYGRQQGRQDLNAARDPLGRQNRSQGSDTGSTVKIPEKFDMQRAREIIKELRRRAGDLKRPQLELDYIERLLERF